MAIRKYQKHMASTSANFDYELIRSTGVLTALTPRGWKNMQNHVLPFELDSDHKCVKVNPQSVDDMAAEIKREGYTINVIGAASASGPQAVAAD